MKDLKRRACSTRTNPYYRYEREEAEDAEATEGSLPRKAVVNFCKACQIAISNPIGHNTSIEHQANMAKMRSEHSERQNTMTNIALNLQRKKRRIRRTNFDLLLEDCRKLGIIRPVHEFAGFWPVVPRVNRSLTFVRPIPKPKAVLNSLQGFERVERNNNWKEKRRRIAPVFPSEMKERYAQSQEQNSEQTLSIDSQTPIQTLTLAAQQNQQLDSQEHFSWNFSQQPTKYTDYSTKRSTFTPSTNPRYYSQDSPAVKHSYRPAVERLNRGSTLNTTKTVNRKVRSSVLLNTPIVPIIDQVANALTKHLCPQRVHAPVPVAQIVDDELALTNQSVLKERSLINACLIIDQFAQQLLCPSASTSHQRPGLPKLQQYNLLIRTKLEKCGTLSFAQIHQLIGHSASESYCRFIINSLRKQKQLAYTLPRFESMFDRKKILRPILHFTLPDNKKLSKEWILEKQQKEKVIKHLQENTTVSLSEAPNVFNMSLAEARFMFFMFHHIRTSGMCIVDRRERDLRLGLRKNYSKYAARKSQISYHILPTVIRAARMRIIVRKKDRGTTSNKNGNELYERKQEQIVEDLFTPTDHTSNTSDTDIYRRPKRSSKRKVFKKKRIVRRRPTIQTESDLSM